MSFAAWIVLIIVTGVLFGGLIWSIAIAIKGSNVEKTIAGEDSN